jgi:hypothetical protein
MSFAETTTDELATAIADKLAARATGELIDARELANRIGRSRDWVYGNAGQLGAIRLGNGTRPRLGFRWPAVLDRRVPTAAELLPIRSER